MCTALIRFLEVIQDYALHLSLTASRADGPAPPHSNDHLLSHPLQRAEHLDSAHSSCRLYHSHSVISAILSARQLVTNAASGGKKQQSTPLSATRPAQVELSKQENSGQSLVPFQGSHSTGLISVTLFHWCHPVLHCTCTMYMCHACVYT